MRALSIHFWVRLLAASSSFSISRTILTGDYSLARMRFIDVRGRRTTTQPGRSFLSEPRNLAVQRIFKARGDSFVIKISERETEILRYKRLYESSVVIRDESRERTSYARISVAMRTKERYSDTNEKGKKRERKTDRGYRRVELSTLRTAVIVAFPSSHGLISS